MPQGLIERYRDRLSLEPGDPVVTLKEGSTPLIASPRLSERVGAEVLLKFEGANPTGSFKDRGMTVAVSRAKGSGAEAILCASTGNTAASCAAYAARAGMRGVVIVPVCVNCDPHAGGTSAASTVTRIRSYGAWAG